MDPRRQPLRATDAERLIRRVAADGRVTIVDHAEERMGGRQVAVIEIEKALRGGVVAEAEFENRAWRHRVTWGKIVLVVEIQVDAPDDDDATEEDATVVVVTVWRNR